MADDTKPVDTPGPKIVPQTGEATAAAATTGSPAAGRDAAAPATGANPAATPHATTTPAARPAPAPGPAAHEWVLRAQHGLHPSRMHAELSLGGEQVQVPVPRQRLPDHWRQLRRAGAATARTLPCIAGRRRPDPGRQEPQVPVRARSVEG